ncbi:MAG: DUF1553 domain-containing protein, partial [Verrucomicrobiales bacterium]|nr:DUF1553 domain-containing protein [Verrucomicrobiales bacterium]
LKSIAHEIEDLKMPKSGAQLDPQLIADFRTWVEMGAPDPRDAPPSAEQLSQDTNWEAIRERRKGWWSFQPVRDPEVPTVANAKTPVDRFIRARLEREEIVPAAPADPRVLHRRLTFALVGLPPSLEDSETFLKAWNVNPDNATEELVDNLLASPAFGERWARHWMDWMRYAETHGSEGDPTIPHAHQYRDYLIRALNADVSYEQLVKEHLAGDLLSEPRINEDLRLNESVIGPAHYRMVFHGFAPTDALDERVKFTDDQINTVTKAFLGLTVSCARCHDHKFDAISQADYYAMFGIFTSGLPATVAIDAPGVLETNREELTRLKAEIRAEAAEFWQASLRESGLDWEAPAASMKWVRELMQSDDQAAAWTKSRKDFEAEMSAFRELRKSGKTNRVWDLTDPAEVAQWTVVGEGLDVAVSAPSADFVVGMSGLVDRFLPAGLFSHLLSTRHRGFIASPPQHLDDEYDLYLNVAGEKSSARFAVQNYPRKGTVYPTTNLEKGEWQWVKYHRIDYWKGDDIHLELSTGADAPVLVNAADRSWFGIREAVLVKKGSASPAAPKEEWLTAIFASAGDRVPKNAEEVERFFVTAVEKAMTQWATGGSLTDAAAFLLDDLRAAGVLPNGDAELPEELRSLLEEYRSLESEIPEPTRAPGITERPGIDQPLYHLGNHKEPREPVARRFLEAIDETPYDTDGSGRLELASDFFREDNPFTARVAVNRVWTHLFGNGLVATVDNFGRLGEEPSHPELLDHLATRFRGELEWSVKALVRELVLTDTFQQASNPSPEVEATDPDNRLLSHFPVRRLDAESIRDSLLALSGELEETRYGPSGATNAKRRSLYLRVARNNLVPLLTTFDFPVPASTVGKRDATNVPAQSLTLLNDPFVSARAAAMSDRAREALGAEADEEAMMNRLFLTALNREPTIPEADSARSFLQTLDDQYRVESEKRADLESMLSKLEASKEALVGPVRKRLFEGQDGGVAKSEMGAPDLRPVSHWSFDRGLNDLAGEASLKLNGSARVVGGALILDGGGYASSLPLPDNLSAKTLEAVVELESLDQRGGGVITVQDSKGSNFDSIVFAEKRPQRWLAGSDRHRRTANFNGPDETEAKNRPVRLTFTYEEDGTITGYRDGRPLGESIRVAELQEFQGGNYEVVLGIRHGKRAEGNRALRGRVYEATFYDRALTPEEVAVSAGRKGPFVSRDMILNSLTDAQSKELESLDNAIEKARSALSEFVESPSDSGRRWKDLAHAIFNLKEFIYLQ